MERRDGFPFLDYAVFVGFCFVAYQALGQIGLD